MGPHRNIFKVMFYTLHLLPGFYILHVWRDDGLRPKRVGFHKILLCKGAPKWSILLCDKIWHNIVDRL